MKLKNDHLSQLIWADSRLLNYTVENDLMKILMKTWKDEEKILLLSGVCGIHDLGIIGLDISHANILSSHQMIDKIHSLHGDQEEYRYLELWAVDLDREPLFQTVFLDATIIN